MSNYDKVRVNGQEGWFKVYCKNCDNLLGYAYADCSEGRSPVDGMYCYTCTMKDVKVEQWTEIK